MASAIETSIRTNKVPWTGFVLAPIAAVEYFRFGVLHQSIRNDGFGEAIFVTGRVLIEAFRVVRAV